MADSSIQWTKSVWNPVVGCARVSTGCGGNDGGGCYAERMAHRLATMPQSKDVYAGLTRMTKGGPRWTGEAREVPARLSDPLHWKKGRKIFVNSMSDLFHKDISNEHIAAAFGVMAACPRHTFQILTKRAERLPEWFDWAARGPDGRSGHQAQIRCSRAAVAAGLSPNDVGYDTVNGTSRWSWPLPNVHLGVSAENQETADERIPFLLQTPACIRWVSAEPLLSAIDFNGIDATKAGWRAVNGFPEPTAISAFGKWQETPMRARLQNGIDWVVVGGESGPGARPFDFRWAMTIRDQCKAAGAAFFMKQAGACPRVVPGLATERPMYSKMHVFGLRQTFAYKFNDGHGGDPAEWPEEFPREFPVVAQ